MASWWNTLKRALRNEAADAKEEFEKLRDSIDRELTRKERELEASPAERVEMILEEIEAGDGRLDEIARELQGRIPDDKPEGAPNDGAPGNGAASSEPQDGAAQRDGRQRDGAQSDEAPSDTSDPPRAPRARLLVPADVSSSPLLGHALTMVSVEDPAPDRDFDHQVLISPEAEPVIGLDRLAGLPAEVGGHALVVDVASDTPTAFLVEAPGLHHEDVQLIAAAALAAYLPDNEKEEPGDDSASPPPHAG